MSKRNAAERFDDLPDLSPDREEKLASNFDDPGIDLILSDVSVSSGEGPSIAQEAAAAVHELILEAGADSSPSLEGSFELPASDAGMQLHPGLDVAQEANSQFAADAAAMMHAEARADMAERMFALVNCDKSFQALTDGALLVLMEAVQAEAGSILELDHGKAEFFFRSSQGGGDAAKVKSFRVPQGQGIVGHVVRAQEPILLASLETDEKQLRAISLSSGFEAKSCLAAPILIQNQVFGAVELFNKKTGTSFGEAELKLLGEGVQMLAKIFEVRFLMAELARRIR